MTRPDARVHDPQVLDEIELYAELVIAASSSEQPLTRGQVDAILGIGGPTGPARSRQPA